MTIAELLKGIRTRQIDGPLKKEIAGMAYDSRLVKKGFLFVAIKGFSEDGHDFVEEAVKKGAVGVVVEHAVNIKDKTTVIEVNDSRKALALLARGFYGQPSRDLFLIGITGTNGKTSTGYIVKSIIEAWRKKVSLIGTIQYLINDRAIPAAHTTPESLDLQRYFKEMVEKNINYSVIEVSSHALALKRVEGCSFHVAAFTNFSQDHLDFHGTMQEYFATKSMIFRYLKKGGWAVLNWDDPLVRSLTKRLKSHVITCGMEEGAMIKAENVEQREQGGLFFEIQTPDNRFSVHSELVGRNNIYNILISTGIAYALGIDRDAITEGIRKAKHIEGRFEKIEGGQEFLCVVDYAHTEDALRTMIQETRQVVKGRVITVFGCGGDRDKTKRPAMGAVATDLSDFAIITSDNPRTENPREIIHDITGGIRKKNYVVEPDRKKAIEKAVSMAQRGDAVLIAGKGHEDYQEIRGVRHPFSDKSVVRETIIKKLKH
jgi:UDP-N-acetylmuramoyl-L-alanyl-D-glutamate--2,6-diaminopimelate ligase